MHLFLWALRIGVRVKTKPWTKSTSFKNDQPFLGGYHGIWCTSLLMELQRVWVCVCCLGDRNRTQVWSQRDFSGLNAHLAAVGLQYSVALCVPNYQVTSALPILYRVWEKKKTFLGLKLKLFQGDTGLNWWWIVSSELCKAVRCQFQLPETM